MVTMFFGQRAAAAALADQISCRSTACRHSLRPRRCSLSQEQNLCSSRAHHRGVAIAASRERESQLPQIMSPLVLDVARDEVLSYCRRMQQQDDTEGFDSSWQAYIYLTQKTEKQEKACDIEIKDEIVDGKACQELNMFKQYIRTQMRHGNMKGFIDTLVRDALVEQIQIEREEKGATLGEVIKQVDDSVPGPESPARDALNKSLREIFDEYDANKDGKLNVAEFRTAMKSMGDELSARTVSTIYQALDSHGWMTFDEFVTVVEAEQVRSHTQFAKVLRIMARGQSIYSGELPDGMHSIDM